MSFQTPPLHPQWLQSHSHQTQIGHLVSSKLIFPCPCTVQPPVHQIYQAQTSLPSESLFSNPSPSTNSPLSWHETHTEYLRILSGTALITLSHTTQTYTSTSGRITVPRYARHEWRRAFPDGPPLVVQEWTEPADGLKEVFFRLVCALTLIRIRFGESGE
ncbi:uncharacterized protein LY89DRAFT_680778 [Mollisia scopiformis]|uniref:Cupin 2 conserved barrel domain-containing protein n=1 Tax=Mollisia scopiformis TaxID=149040 RepID=A0A194XRI6_MOLSC|nr:uncharacterized protein LY89DRAFT_680778 [Mollisia scopiformis]KUJ22664.1 hypothetical protein LY89DRAFT_680778 [Mollisia scopiformis]